MFLCSVSYWEFVVWSEREFVVFWILLDQQFVEEVLVNVPTFFKMVNGKDIFNVYWPNSLELIEGFCTVCEQPWVDLNPRPFAQKATTLTTAPRRPQAACVSSLK